MIIKLIGRFLDLLGDYSDTILSVGVSILLTATLFLLGVFTGIALEQGGW